MSYLFDYTTTQYTVPIDRILSVKNAGHGSQWISPKINIHTANVSPVKSVGKPRVTRGTP